MKVKRILGATIFSIGLVLAAFVFIVVQVLTSYPFHIYLLPAISFSLPMGTDKVFGALAYDQLLEIGVGLAFIGLFIWGVSKFGKINRNAITYALGFTSFVTGSIGAVVVYADAILPWSVFPWFGVTDGGGYPWITERVTSNTGFMKMPSYTPRDPNVYFLNYAEVLVISVLLAILGFVLYKKVDREHDEVV